VSETAAPTAAEPSQHTVSARVDNLEPHPRNPRRGDVQAIADSLRRHGQYRPIVVQQSTGHVLAGNHTFMAARYLGWEYVDAVFLDVDDQEALRILLVDNRTADLGTYDEPVLALLLQDLPDLEGTGYAEEDLDALLDSMAGDSSLEDLQQEQEERDPAERGERPDAESPVAEPAEPEAPRPTLADRFVVPPFSVLDARSGPWRNRKTQWLAHGIQSELGRGEGLAHSNQAGIADIQGGWGVTPTRSTKAGGPHPGGGGGGAWIGRSTDGTTAPADPGYAKGRALTVASASGRVPTYYTQKEAAEARLGRELSHDEFTRDHLDSSGSTENLSTSGTSIFDPVLVELAVRWFSPAAGHVLDPFAGGSVRGLVTALLGRSYEGVELRQEQVDANDAQRGIAPAGADLTWTQGDSREVLAEPGRPADLLLSCPPYAYLERYSDDPQDLSTLSAEEFRTAHADVIRKAVDRLAPNRFAVWVIGDVRSKRGDGRYLGLIRDTIDAFEAAGAGFYNEMIYVTPVGSLAVRAGRQFMAGRKVGRTHQHVLVFVKGDGMQAARDCGLVDVTVPEVEAQEELELPDHTPELTPVERWGGHLVKRDDAYVYAGQAGGKVRSCRTLAEGATGLVTASSRTSPQALIVASIAQRLGIPARLHVPAAAEDTETLARVRAFGAEVIEHRPGYNTVIVARAREDAAAQGMTLVPFGMECQQAVDATAAQVAALREHLLEVRRIVMPVGSAMSLSGVLHGMSRAGFVVPVLGVRVGADPTERLQQWAPEGWEQLVTLVESGLDYHQAAPETDLGGLELDPWYEAKCLPFLQEGDLLWVVGNRSPRPEYGFSE